MIVRIGDQYFDSEKEPIMIILDEKEKRLISEMGYQSKFCRFPKKVILTEIVEFMKGGGENVSI